MANRKLTHSKSLWRGVIPAVVGVALLALFPIFQNCAKGVIPHDLVNLSSNIENPQSEEPEVEGFTHIYQNLPLDIAATDDAASALLGPGIQRETNLDYLRVFSSTGYQIIVSDATVGIDPSKSYTISGVFKSSGETPSRLYFGFMPFYGEDRQMHSLEYSCRGTAAKVASIAPMEITATAALAGWQTGAVQAQFRNVGFYLDGDTTHTPDFVYFLWDDMMSTAPEKGGYSAAAGTKISLNGSLSIDWVTTVQQNPDTVVMQHTNGDWHLYPAARDLSVPTTWTVVSGTSTGEVFNPTPTQFPVGIKLAKIVILANFLQDGNSKLLFTNIKLTVK